MHCYTVIESMLRLYRSMLRGCAFSAHCWSFSRSFHAERALRINCGQLCGVLPRRSHDVARRSQHQSVCEHSGGKSSDGPIVAGVLVSTTNTRRSNKLASTLFGRMARRHVEFELPHQGNGNSGVLLRAIYELLILGASTFDRPPIVPSGSAFEVMQTAHRHSASA